MLTIGVANELDGRPWSVWASRLAQRDHHVIVIETTVPGIAEAWAAALTLAREHPTGWTVIGAQMVALHAAERGRTPLRQSLDLDVLVNVRLLTTGTEQLARWLVAAGFDLEGQDSFGIGHRFRRGQATIDLLAPDGLSERTRLLTIPPARTVSVPGGTQALERSQLVEIQVGDRRGQIPRPSLIGAILVKARAVAVDDVPEAQRLDLAFLLSLVDNPRSVRASLSSSERRWLRERTELRDPGHPAWRSIDEPEVGQRALSVLSAADS
jgi:hypothetical protein